MDPTYVSNDTITSGALSRINDLWVVIGALGAAVLGLAAYVVARQRKDDRYRDKEADRIEKFMDALKDVAHANKELGKSIDRNSLVIEDNTRTIIHAFTDPKIPKPPRRT